MVFEDEIGTVLLPTGDTVTSQGAPVNLVNLPASRLLMQAVNILGDDPGQLSVFLHFRKDPVRGIRFDPPAVQILSEIGKEHFRFSEQAVGAQEVLRTIPGKAPVRFPVQPVPAPEIRDPALRGYTCPAQKCRLGRRVQHLPECLHLLFARKGMKISELLPLIRKFSHSALLSQVRIPSHPEKEMRSVRRARSVQRRSSQICRAPLPEHRQR